MAKQAVKGKVHILTDRCKGCMFCIEFCPTKVLRASKSLNKSGYHYPKVEHAENCSGCDLCGMLCPDFAIWSEKINEGEKARTKK